jgi:hypothetical protein
LTRLLQSDLNPSDASYIDSLASQKKTWPIISIIGDPRLFGPSSPFLPHFELQQMPRLQK